MAESSVESIQSSKPKHVLSARTVVVSLLRELLLEHVTQVYVSQNTKRAVVIPDELPLKQL